MSGIPLFGMGIASKSPYVTAKHYQNMYFETRPAGEKSTIVGYKTPGLNLFTDAGNNPARGLYSFDKSDIAFGVFLNQFVQIGGSGSITPLGTLSTFNGHVSISDNGNQIMIVDGSDGYIYITSPLVQTISSIVSTNITATVTTASPHGLGTGMIITLSGAIAAGYNGTYTITVIDASTFSIVLASPPVLPVTISSITQVTTAATLTTATAHGLSTGDTITVAGATPAAFNGTFVITVTSPLIFTYTMLSAPGSNATPVGSYTIVTTRATTVGVYSITSSFARITDTDFLPNPTTVTFLAGRFIVTYAVQSRFYWSDPYDGLSWDALNFTNAETSPDPNIAVWASNGQAILFGSRTTEFFGVSGSSDQAYTPVNSTASEWGLAAQWSVAKFDNTLCCLMRGRMGQVMIAKLNGYVPQKISNPDVDSIINNYSTVSDAVAYSYMLGGHAMYVINFPTVGFTWLYDAFTQIWTQLKSFDITRHRVEIAFSFLTMTIGADFETGLLYEITANAYKDNGQPIESEIISENISDPDLNRLTVNKLRVDMQVGMGDIDVEFPQIGLSVSRDNGRTYGAEMLEGVGPIGNYSDVVEWNRLGTSRDFVFKLRMNDAFPFTLVRAMINPKD